MINLYGPKEIDILKEGGRLLYSILERLRHESREGVTGIELNQRAQKLIEEKGAWPSFLNYRNFPAALCISINDELVHGVPKNQPIQKGDLVSLDLGISWKGFCLDKSITFPVGKIGREKKRFLKTIKRALDKGIEKAREGNRLGEISATIFEVIKKGGYSTIRELSGHGVGKKVHEEPKVPNFGKKDEGPILKEGMVLAIEPMATMGEGKIKVEKDGFTISSFDNSPACHFEDTIAITKNKPIILTRI